MTHDFGSPLAGETAEHAKAWSEFAATYAAYAFGGVRSITEPLTRANSEDAVLYALLRLWAAALDDSGPELRIDPTRLPDKVELDIGDGLPLVLPRNSALSLAGRLQPIAGGMKHWDAYSALVGLHGTLEHYFVALFGPYRGSLIRAVEPYLLRPWVRSLLPADAILDPQPRQLSHETIDALRELDLARNIIVHNRGLVDEPFLRAIRDAGRFTLNDYYPITDARLLAACDAVYLAGRHLRLVAG